MDKVLRGLLFKVLGLQRMYPCLHSELESEEGQQLGQKFWGLLLDFDKSIVTQRKMQSIPTAVVPKGEVFFSQEDLKNTKEKENIDKMGKGWSGSSSGFGGKSTSLSGHNKFPFSKKESFSSTVASQQETYCLLPSPGRGFKYRNWRSKGAGGWQKGGGSYKGGRGGKSKGKGKCPGAASAASGGPTHRGGPPSSSPSTHSGLGAPPRQGAGKWGRPAPSSCTTSTCARAPGNSPGGSAQLKECGSATHRGGVKRGGDAHLPNQLQERLSWWKKWAKPHIVKVIQEGIRPQWSSPPKLSLSGRQGPNLEQAKEILLDYQKSGAVKEVQDQNSQHLLPWFLISKPEEGGGQSGGSFRTAEKSTSFSRFIPSSWITPSKFFQPSRRATGPHRSTSRTLIFICQSIPP